MASPISVFARLLSKDDNFQPMVTSAHDPTGSVDPIEIAPGVRLGDGSLPIIAGPCVIESPELVLGVAETLKALAGRLGLPLVFKSSYDKANRSSESSFRGRGMAAGLDALRRVKEATGLPVLTDVHELGQCAAAAEVCDVLQIPAFLCRQTDLIHAAADTGRAVNIKKGQFMAPDDMPRAVDKARARGNERVFVTERGYSFGYHNLVVDMRAFAMMQKAGIAVVFDVTHSLQLPGGGEVTGGGRGGGRRRLRRDPPRPAERALGRHHAAPA